MSCEYSESFCGTDERIDPSAVPSRRLASGAEMPGIGLGTFGSDHVAPEEIARAVVYAASIGYRHFDCASVYGNESVIGDALSTILSQGVPRDELWVTSKLWNDMHAPEDVVVSCERSLRDLKLDVLDLYLVHWPFPNYHAPGCDVTARSQDSRPYIHEAFMETWRAMESLVEKGWVRHIGTSNMTIPKLECVLRDAAIRPAVNEMELHPHFQQPELFSYVIREGIVPVGYCPIGSPNRPERDRTPEDTVDLEDPVVVSIAEAHGVHPVSICLKWAVQRGQIPIPMSTKPRNLLSNLQAVTEDPLTAAEMEALAGIDKGCRLIKGQVFLWKDDQSWRDLWDEEGVIVS